MPGDRRAPVMADDHGRCRLERVEHADHVADEVKERVLFDLFGTVGLPVAAHVRRDRSVAGFRQRRQLRRHEYQDFRKAMTKEDEWPAPASARWMRMPFASTVRCVISVTAVLPRSVQLPGCAEG